MDPSIWQRIAAQLPSPLAVIDVGARGGVEDQWSQFAPHIRIYGFEPDEAECDRLNRGETGVTTYMPFALSSTAGEQSFYVTEDLFCSSLFPPVDYLIHERPRLAEMRVEYATTIKTRTIDESMREFGIDRLDHLKIDAQGAELAVLEGSINTLDTVRSLRVEVQFSQLYEGTPLFGEIDLFLREHGFVLWRLSELSHCGFDTEAISLEAPEIANYDNRSVEAATGGGQLLWADAYYVRQETTQLSTHIGWEDAVRDSCLAKAHHYADLAQAGLRRSLQSAPGGTQTVLREALASDSTLGLPWQDPVKGMQAVMDELKQAADDRLALVDELKQIADDRLALIDELHGAAASRLRALEATTAQLTAKDAEIRALRDRCR